jgi:phosphohistidine phosphatase
MKRLLALRHGKAEERDKYPTDHERPLTERGKEDSAVMGRALLERGTTPDAVVSSSALRAVETAREVCSALEYRGQPMAAEELYTAGGPEDYLRVLEERLGTRWQEPICVLLVAHNPVMEELVERLARQRVEMKTCHLVCLECEESEEWKIAWILTPKGERR